MPVAVEPPIIYHSFDGDDLILNPWRGRRVALLTASRDLDPLVIERILDGLDAAYEVYLRITGRAPAPFLQYGGLLSIAQVPTAFHGAAAALGYLGATGIEVTPTSFNALYQGVATKGQFDQALFYELGRNFWFYGNQLGRIDAFVTGFAIANRFISMEVAHLAGGPFNGQPFESFKSSTLDGLSSIYFRGSDSIASTLFAGRAPTNPFGWGAADFAGSLMFQIYQNFGLDAYGAFYRQLDISPTAASQAETVSLFIAAASQATGFDFSFVDKPASTAYVTGTAGDDALSADGTANPVQGLGGNDLLMGSGSADRLLGGAGDDELRGEGGDDQLIGGLGHDVLLGGTGNDLLNGGPGGGLLSGGDGQDRLLGGDAMDLLDGGAGDDVLQGGKGSDRIEGGAGGDIFVFATLADSRGLALRSDGGKILPDLIGDFSSGVDKIDLSGIDAIAGTPLNDAFTYIGAAAFTHQAGQLRVELVNGFAHIFGDVDGDGFADIVIVARTPSLQPADFIL